MALRYAGQCVELREVELKNKPVALRVASPKATVPVLVLPDGRVIDQSLEIMHWALAQHDPQNWRCNYAEQQALIARNDGEFKAQLDRYKYVDRHSRGNSHNIRAQSSEARSSEAQIGQTHYRDQAAPFLLQLDTQLASQDFLFGPQMRLADIAVFPFVRQFAGVDPHWFAQCNYAALRRWLNRLLAAEMFAAVMQKYPVWIPSAQAIKF